MKELAQVTNTQAGGGEANAMEADTVALKAEVAKWQERVPKLAAALRERSEALEQAKAQLRELRKDQPADARIQARDELIGELESKLSQAGVQQRELAGRLHTAELETQAQAEQATSWKSKWQALTATLDANVAEKEQLAAATQQLNERLSSVQTDWQTDKDTLRQQTQDMQDEFLQEISQLNEHIERIEHETSKVQQDLQRQIAEVQRLEQECSSLTNRNKTLQDTAELANNQMESMGNEISALSEKLSEQSREMAQWITECEQAQTSVTHLQQANAELSDQVEDATATHKLQEENLRSCWAREVQALQLILAEQAQQIDTLHDANANADADATAAEDLNQATDVAEAQAKELADAVTEIDRLRQQLEERSALVRDLEAEMNAQQDAQNREMVHLREAADQLSGVEAKVLEANNRADTQQAHAVQLEQKLQQQMELLNHLEDELSEAQLHNKEADRQTEEHLRHLQEQLALVTDQKTELQVELSAQRQQLDTLLAEKLSENQNAGNYETEHQTPQTDSVTPSQDKDASLQVVALQKTLAERTEELEQLRWRMEQQHTPDDESLIMVLNQQLTDAREENARLLERLVKAPEAYDDLTRIKGVGTALASQLQELNYCSFAQIAQLVPAELDQPDHPLHSMRSRILRDSWIAQAAGFLAEKTS